LRERVAVAVDAGDRTSVEPHGDRDRTLATRQRARRRLLVEQCGAQRRHHRDALAVGQPVRRLDAIRAVHDRGDREEHRARQGPHEYEGEPATHAIANARRPARVLMYLSWNSGNSATTS